MYKHRAWIVAAAGLMVSACAAEPATGPSLEQRLAKRGYQTGDTVQSVQNYSVDGWNYVDDQHIIVNAGPSRDYLVSLTAPCIELGQVEHIAFTSTNTALTPFDELLVHRNGIDQRCPIGELRQLRRLPSKPAGT